MTLLAIDPGRSYKGEKTIGWCFFTDRGEEIERGSINFEQLLQYLRGDRSTGLLFVPGHGKLYHVDVLVIEDFVNDPKSARGGQRNGTSECIGAVELACAWTTTALYRQQPRILGVAKLHAGYVDTHKHLPHEDSAYLHGHEWFIQEGILQSVGLSDTL